MNFWDTKSGIAQPHQTKVMVIPNITNSKNLEADSFIDVIFNQIAELGDDFFWYIPLPNHVKRLDVYDNVEQINISMSGNMFHMRVNFPLDIINLLQFSTMHPNDTDARWFRDYDVVYSHLPDWSVRRYTPTKKKIIGYCHWWEMPICNGKSNMNNHLNFEHEILGALQMDTLYVNTISQKDVVIEQASEYFNQKQLSKLQNIIQPFYLSIPKEEIVEAPLNDYSKVIVFNHRCAAYKGYPKFMKWMKEYRNRRTDFKLWITQAKKFGEKFKEDWIVDTYLNKSDYFEALRKCNVIVTPYETHFGWSLSATDAMMKGTPVIFEECPNYREINKDAPFYAKDSKEEMFALLDKMLDDSEYRMQHADIALRRANELANTTQFNELAKKLSN
jgi:glycosyltransferase involved in cell wall biosynthesis|tara:strand:+ start:154 stop:1320 length:1167 start_codon:yes stop_codon:yes gene_type:complete